MRDGASRAVVDALQDAGITHAFGLPGTQNLGVFEALRTSGIRTIVATNELTASLMANGYFRASGEVAALVTIPGPGFTYALTGLAEASLDSVALLHLTASPASAPGAAFQLQAIDQAAIAAPIAKAILGIASDDDAGRVARAAVAIAKQGEPGPVILQVGGSQAELAPRADAIGSDDEIDEIARLVDQSRRVVLLVGQGAAAAAADVRTLAEKIGAAVVTTTSGRGVVPEDHALSLGFELAGPLAGPLNDLVGASDLVVALGCKFSHNGARGFDLEIPAEKLVHVDSAHSVINANYRARIGVTARCEDVVPALVTRVSHADGWTESEIEDMRRRGLEQSWPPEPEPRFPGPRTASRLFAALREVLPRASILVTDSGRHQMLARRWFRVLAPRGLMAPSNLQSMGFAIPAAIGARVAAPETPVVAVVGDGSFLTSGMELVTAASEGLALTVLVVNDGAFGQIKSAQLAEFGVASGVDIAMPSLEEFARAIGVDYARIGQGRSIDLLATAVASPGVTLVEVPAREATSMKVVASKARVRTRVRRR